MRILVSDTSVIIDLERAGLLENAFGCGHRFVVPDLLFEREFANDGERLIGLGLEIESLNAEELAFAQKSFQTQKALSLPDCFAMALGTREKYVLLTGDKALRNFAELHQIKCHGVLWLLDRIEESGNVDFSELLQGLVQLASHPRCRLPKAEIAIRVKRWRQI